MSTTPEQPEAEADTPVTTEAVNDEMVGMHPHEDARDSQARTGEQDDHR